jgi:transcriptional regulator with XRE-family HTH domain
MLFYPGKIENKAKMISVSQIKAARALLAWTQRDLARVSGISLAAIAQIERGAGNPRAATMDILQKAFEKYAIEFSDDPGLRIKREPFGVVIWQGHEAMLHCWRDIEETLKGGGILRISPVDDALWKSLYPEEMLAMYKSRTELKIKTLGLLTDPSKNESGWSSKNYRIVPASATAPYAPYYVYEDKVAIIKMKDPIRIVLIENPTLADSFRTQFQYLWDNGKEF